MVAQVVLVNVVFVFYAWTLGAKTPVGALQVHRELPAASAVSRNRCSSPT